MIFKFIHVIVDRTQLNVEVALNHILEGNIGSVQIIVVASALVIFLL